MTVCLLRFNARLQLGCGCALNHIDLVMPLGLPGGGPRACGRPCAKHAQPCEEDCGCGYRHLPAAQLLSLSAVALERHPRSPGLGSVCGLPVEWHR